MLTNSSVLQREVLVFELASVDALAASAVVVGEVASLTHEPWNDAVERAAFVAETFLTGTQCTEVLCAYGTCQQQFNTTSISNSQEQESVLK